ncbi:MAG: hypothetical protein QOE53_2370 [Pseudonocardiales bacterium]|jgi:hypothetical protein|nr:hypothetical protein [Pseudonocardiales bacterium]
MAWVWWLLAPIASTMLGAIVIWWRSPTETGNRLRRADAISEHQALLHALAQKPSTVTSQPGATRVGAAEHPDR